MKKYYMATEDRNAHTTDIEQFEDFFEFELSIIKEIHKNKNDHLRVDVFVGDPVKSESPKLVAGSVKNDD